MSELSAAARNVNWLVEHFVDHIPGVSEAVVVSADGLPMAVSRGLDRDAADRFAAVASGDGDRQNPPTFQSFGG